MLKIEKAVLKDVPAFQEIYSHYVLHSTVTLEDIPPTIEEMEERFRKVIDKGGIWIVAKDSSDYIIGYAYYSQYRERFGYRFTVEVFIFFPI